MIKFEKEHGIANKYRGKPLKPMVQNSSLTKKKVVIAISATVVVSIAATLIFNIYTIQAEKGKNKERTAIPINVATAKISTVPIEIHSIGNVAPYSIVNVTPQVNGQLTKVFFTQGKFVKKGDLLFQIDPRPYQASLDQALGNVAKDVAQVEAAQANLAKDMAQIGQLQANLSRDIAQANYADTEKGRYSELASQGAVSHEQSDQMNTNAYAARATIEADKKAIENAKAVTMADKAQIDTAKAALKADQGAAENTRIQLGWTQIRSPIDGRTGSLNVYEGNIVTANTSTPIVTITQVEPIYVSVTIPEQYLDDVRRSQKEGTLKMQALIEGMKANSVEGTISFMENTVNTSTGTILMRASFANTDQRLYPGQFVDVILTMPPAGESVVIPANAVQTTQQGQSVYVVRNGKADLVKITAGQTYTDFTSIKKGVSAGDIVVTDGQLKLNPGSKVQIEPTPTDE